MTQAIDHELQHETQRTIEDLGSCCALIERLAQLLANLLQIPEAGALDQAVAALAPTMAKLQGAVHVLQGCASGTPATRGGAGATILPNPTLRGVSPPISVTTLLEFLSQHRKTGALRVVSRHETFTLEISNGDVVHAISDSPPPEQRLGRILVQRGALPADQLVRFLERYNGSALRMGEALRKEELVRVDQLEGALRQQVQSLFQRLFALDEAEFFFWEGKASPPDIHIRLSVIQLLLEAARRRDERGRGDKR